MIGNRPGDSVGDEIGRLAASAAAVYLHRAGHMATGRLTAEEALRMMLEKPHAFGLSAVRSGAAAMGGAFPATIMAQSLVPIRAAAEANAARLTEAVDPAPAPLPPVRADATPTVWGRLARSTHWVWGRHG